MGLRTSAQRRLARWAARRPHVLLVTAPGGTAERLAVEAELRPLGGLLTGGPADADLLVTAGTPRGGLSDAIELLWSQVPAPRVRLGVPEPARVGAALAAAIQRLAATPESGVEERTEPDRVASHGDADDDRGHGEHQDHAHGGHDHGGMEMPGGLMMADRGPDRDGLKLDVLHVALGPVLPAWPSGLVVDVELQGDLVQSATGRVLESGGISSFWTAFPVEPRRRASAHLDSIGRLLDVAGWAGAAEEARRQRDELLAGTAGGAEDGALRNLRPLRRRLERSRGLRRSLSGLGRLEPEAVDSLRLSGPSARATGRGGDAWARLVTWLEESELALVGRPVAPTEGPRGELGRGSDALLAAAVQLMPGLDLADARLVMASLDPDLDELDEHEGQVPVP